MTAHSSPMKSIITVPLPDQSYPVMVAEPGLAHLGPWLATGEQVAVQPGQKILLVSNPTIFKHYGPLVVDSLQQSGYAVRHLLLPAGERYKTLRSIQKKFTPPPWNFAWSDNLPWCLWGAAWLAT